MFDRSLEGIGALVCGANKADHHYTGFNIARDYGKVTYLDIAKATPGGICPVCGKKTLRVSNGIEVGNIFQLGTKYTKTMNMQYLDENGELQYPIMGCYGIGVGRLAASVCEESHDDYGPIWPISLAPWEAQICVLRADQEEPKRVGEELYAALTKAGVRSDYRRPSGQRRCGLFGSRPHRRAYPPDRQPPQPCGWYDRAHYAR